MLLTNIISSQHTQIILHFGSHTHTHTHSVYYLRKRYNKYTNRFLFKCWFSLCLQCFKQQLWSVSLFAVAFNFNSYFRIIFGLRMRARYCAFNCSFCFYQFSFKIFSRISVWIKLILCAISIFRSLSIALNSNFCLNSLNAIFCNFTKFNLPHRGTHAHKVYHKKHQKSWRKQNILKNVPAK